MTCSPCHCADALYSGLKNQALRLTATVEKATEMDRKYLDLGDYDCLAVVSSNTFNADGVMFEYTESRHRPDRFAFSTVAVRRKA